MASRRGKQNLTAEQERTFLQLLQLGSYQAQAARKLGLSPSAISMRKARNPAFRAAVEAAEAGLEMGLVAHLVKAAPKDWRAALAMLERRFPERWSRPEIRAQLTAVNVDTGDRKFKLRSQTTWNPPRSSCRPRTSQSRRSQEPAWGSFRPVARPPDAPLPRHDLPEVTAPFPPLLRGTLVDVDDPASRRRRTAPRLLRHCRRQPHRQQHPRDRPRVVDRRQHPPDP
jgi:hypothetical protein